MIDWDLIDKDVVAIVRKDCEFTGLVYKDNLLVYEFSECQFYGDGDCVAIRPDKVLKVFNSYQHLMSEYKKAYEDERNERKALAIKLNKKESND